MFRLGPQPLRGRNGLRYRGSQGHEPVFGEANAELFSTARLRRLAKRSRTWKNAPSQEFQASTRQTSMNV